MSENLSEQMRQQKPGFLSNACSKLLFEVLSFEFRPLQSSDFFILLLLLLLLKTKFILVPVMASFMVLGLCFFVGWPIASLGSGRAMTR